MTKILITGGNGFIGSHVIDRLLQLGCECVSFDPCEKKYYDQAGYKWINGDILSLQDLTDASNDIDGFIHLAAISRVGEGFKTPHRCIELNVIGTTNVLEVARLSKRKPWVILGSSIEVKDSHYHKAGYFRNIDNIYGLTKLINELCSERYATDYDMKIMVLRFASVYGSTRDNQDKVMLKLINKAIRNEELQINSPSQMLNYIHISDLIEGIISGIEYLESKHANRGLCYFDVFNLSSEEMTTLRDLAELIVSNAKSTSRILITASQGKQDSYNIIDISKTKTILNFKPKISLNSGIKDLISQFICSS